MAKVDCEINGSACSVEDGVWTSKDKKFAKVLNGLEEIRSKLRVDPDPNPDAASARDLIDLLGGEIVSAPPPLEVDEETADRVY